MQEIYFIGGDKRMQYAKESLRASGFACRDFSTIAPTKEELLSALQHQNKIIVLPLPASRDGKTIVMENAEISIRELAKYLLKGDRVFGGKLQESVKDTLRKNGADVVDYFTSDFITKNAVLTAQCVPTVLEECLKEGISGRRLAILGYGKIAKALVPIIKKKGASVTVFARREDAVQVAKTVCDACFLEELKNQIQNFDCIINTVPARILEDTLLKNIKAPTWILELASPPYCVDFLSAEQLGVPVIKASGLPGRYAPAKAGYFIGETLKNLL